jgi:Holliday junction DNA helicase RuvB
MSKEPESFIESSLKREDEQFEVTLRPQALDDFAGQHALKERLAVVITAARQRNEPLGHCIFSGPPGLGKTTLANILAKSMGTRLVVTSGPVIEKPAELAGILTSLKEGEILFIDEIHRLNRVVEEYLYPAMEDFVLDLMIDSGPNARSVQLKLNRFTLVGATTRMGMLSAPLRSRFTFSGRLDYYEPQVLQTIILRSAAIMNLTLDEEGAFEVARRSRGTPRIANNLLRWVRDYAQIRAKGIINKEVADKALSMLAIDQDGLDETDKRLLSVLIDHYGGGPVGVSTLAVAMGEEPSTLEEVHEPFLILQGLIKRTPRGREATARAYQSLGREV